MTFNTLQFALFLPLVFCIYWAIGQGRWKVQNIFLLAASYFFYGWWDYRFCALLLTTTVISYSTALACSHRSY